MAGYDYRGGFEPPMAAVGFGDPVRSPAAFSVNPNQGISKLGTRISDDGTVEISFLVEDLEKSFAAVRDFSRFLSALYPDYSSPALVAGMAYEKGAIYKIESWETREIHDLDSAEKTATIRKRKTIHVREMVAGPDYKIVNFDVDSEWISTYFSEPFLPTTFISVEMSPDSYEVGRFLINISFNGGPPKVVEQYCCVCIQLPASAQQKEESVEARPYVHKQARQVTEYIKNYDYESSTVASLPSYQYSPPVQKRPSRAEYSPQVSPYGGPPPGQFAPPTPPRNPSPPVPPRMAVSPLPGAPANYGSPYGADYGAGSPRPINERSPPGWAPEPSPSGAGTSADEIRKLFDLYRDGALTKEEYELEKKRIIARHEGKMKF